MIRAAVLYYAKPSVQPKLKLVAEALAVGMRSQGAQVEVINGVSSRETKLTGFHYIAVGCDVRSWFKGVLPPELAPSLANSGIITGKRCFAFTLKAPLGTDSTLTKLMRAMEREGMLLRFSEAFAKPDQARLVGQQLKLD